MILLSEQERANAASQILPPAVFDYFAGGSENELTLTKNRQAYERLSLRPRVLRGVAEPSTACRVLGSPLASPLLLAPIGHLKLAHPEGELATARATRAAESIFIVSTFASKSIEAIGDITGPGRAWMQLYVFRDREITRSLMSRAEASGYGALVLTVDAPTIGSRRRDLRSGFHIPDDCQPANIPATHLFRQPPPGQSVIAQHAAAMFDATIDWDIVAWIRSESRLPLVIKGILTGEDAELAVAAGVDGIIVSNHGGRQLDSTPASIEVLEEIVSAVAGRCEVYLDGGIREATDLVKALALGARAVLIGRPYAWGLAISGEQGVRDVLSRFNTDLRTTMILMGCASLDQLGPSAIHRH